LIGLDIVLCLGYIWYIPFEGSITTAATSIIQFNSILYFNVLTQQLQELVDGNTNTNNNNNNNNKVSIMTTNHLKTGVKSRNVVFSNPQTLNNAQNNIPI
jgi:hypothetical protein